VIALIDYGAGNLRSVHKALRYLNADVRLAVRPADLKRFQGGGSAPVSARSTIVCRRFNARK